MWLLSGAPRWGITPKLTSCRSASAGGLVQNEEILNSLKCVDPMAVCHLETNFLLLEKCELNDSKVRPLFELLREALPAPSNDPTMLITDPKLIIWSPVFPDGCAWDSPLTLAWQLPAAFCGYFIHDGVSSKPALGKA
uniref:Uncharacterized protein n=1 Tax=Sciurus vulgaris TaxID=55149 RepID=A0A8D2D4K7_SCIVU